MIKKICFPFSGGNRYSFNRFARKAPDFTFIEYPGRGLRTNEELISDLNQLIDDLLPKITDEISSCNEYIIYGHSMGALVGYLICQKIEEFGFTKPLKLVISGENHPQIKRREKIAHLPNNQFWEEVVEMGGVPTELLNFTELIEHYTPILKADFTAIENYHYVKNKKLTIPIDVFYGSEEKITEEEIKEWKNATTGVVNITQLEGNHFFIFKHVDFFSHYFKNIAHSFNK